jgi:hypothetical protein
MRRTGGFVERHRENDVRIGRMAREGYLGQLIERQHVLLREGVLRPLTIIWMSFSLSSLSFAMYFSLKNCFYSPIIRLIESLTQSFSCRRTCKVCGSSWFRIVPAANPIGLVEKVLSIAEGRFSILVDRNNDRLDMLVAPTLAAARMLWTSWTR